ncbi:hypothetical protein RO08_06985 [Fusobacterium animalis]|nr:hypothetical protein RO08_06985 [Fusobacterium animalis]
MNIKVVEGLNSPAKIINYLDFYNELNKIEIPQVFIEYKEIVFLPHKEICIESFYSEPPNLGYGTKAMLEIIKIANKFNIVLSLKPSTDAGKDYISTFWRKLGFQKGTKDFDDGYYFRYYDGYERNNQNEGKKENNKKTFLEKIKTFFK